MPPHGRQAAIAGRGANFRTADIRRERQGYIVTNRADVRPINIVAAQPGIAKV